MGCYFCGELITMDDDTDVFGNNPCHSSCLEDAMEEGKICTECGGIAINSSAKCELHSVKIQESKLF